MKKLFTLFALCCAVFALNAQNATVTLEAHNVWGDGSGYQLLLDADHTAFGDIIPETGPLSTSGNVSATVYAEFEYKIPQNADGNLSTSNMVYDGIETITIPAGTYDYCITNPTPGDRMWIAGGDNARKDDFVFEAGKTYHFTMQMNGEGGDEAVLTVSGVGIQDVDAPQFSIYPNPATSILNVEGEGLAEVYNALGQMVISENVNGSAQLNVSNLETGVYFVRMNGGTQRFIKK